MIPLSDESHTIRKRFPFITLLLIAANVYFFLITSEATYELYGLRASDFQNGQNLLNIITSMFLHGGWLHLIFNMLSLWIFGDNIEDELGIIKYLFIYFVSGIAGGALFALLSEPQAIAVGASGAISGIMGAYLILHPRNRIHTLIPLGFFITTARIPATIFIGLWFLLQFLGFLFGAGSAIAYSAHVGGFVAGVILALLLRKNI